MWSVYDKADLCKFSGLCVHGGLRCTDCLLCQINARKIYDEINVTAGVFGNPLFLGILGAEAVLQVRTAACLCSRPAAAGAAAAAAATAQSELDCGNQAAQHVHTAAHFLIRC